VAGLRGHSLGTSSFHLCGCLDHFLVRNWLEPFLRFLLLDPSALWDAELELEASAVRGQSC
jgi:hypothetical protein